MKPALWAMAAVAAGLFAFTTFHSGTGTIKGNVTPSNGASEVKVYAGNDSVAEEVSGGSFEVKNLKPATYRLKIVSIAPYKTQWREGIKVMDGNITDVGEIKLEQEAAALHP